MIDDYRDLVLSTEIQILSHALADKHCLEQVSDYKFQRGELKQIFNEIKDIQDNNYEPVIESLWDKYPMIYGRLQVKEHSNINALLSVAMRSKARLYTYDKLMTHIGMIAGSNKPLTEVLDEIIHDLKIVKGVLDE